MNAEGQEQVLPRRNITSREFNVLFVQTVQRFPCIWDRNLLENRIRNIANITWQEIAKILDNKLTPKQCQTRWRSLRNAYTARLRKEARTGAKVRYMNGIMEFIRPHTSYGAAATAEDGHDSSSDCEVIEEPVVSTGAHELVELSDDEPEVTTTTMTSGYYEDTARNNLDYNDYDDAPAACQHVRIDSADGDALFLLSMLPEMEAMTEEQKQTFKDTVQALVAKFEN